MILSSRDISYGDRVRAHYEAKWSAKARVERWKQGPTHQLPSDFQILVFQPNARRFWTYATCGMSQPDDDVRTEVHLFSPIETADHVELLTMIAHYHRTGARLGLGHTVNFGRPWLPKSACDHGLISLPYLDGPSLEQLEVEDGSVVSFLWLVPVTASEVVFATRHGLDVLERRFEEESFNYLDPMRPAVA